MKYRKGKAKKMKSTKLQKTSKCGYVLVAKPGIYGCGVYNVFEEQTHQTCESL